VNEGVLNVEILSLSLYEGAPFGEPGGGLHYWAPWKMCNSRFWGWDTLLTGALSGNLKGGLYTEDFE